MVIQAASSPHFHSEVIDVEFLVLHYTACSLEKTLEVFSSPEKKVCAHFVIDRDGTLYDLGGFWSGPILRGAHAGVSSFKLDDKIWEDFNKFSVGVEIVNFNGNLFPYSLGQYESLVELTQHLQQRFSLLNDPRRIVGHEHIAGFRGKVDPGQQFDWNLYFSLSFPPGVYPQRMPFLDSASLLQFKQKFGPIDLQKLKSNDWSQLSSQLEIFAAEMAKRNEGRSND